jgi:hypothetical protein
MAVTQVVHVEKLAMQQDIPFQQFSYQQQDFSQTYEYTPQVDIPQSVSFQSIRKAFSASISPEEPPLLEELGINFSHIFQKTMAVLLFRTDTHFIDDTDLAGPILFCFALGGFLLLSGKAHFGYIYGIAVVGCTSMWAIMNLLNHRGIDIYQTACVLGYSLLPIVLLSCVSVLMRLDGMVGLVLSMLVIVWCAISASGIFVSVLEMKEQRLLVAYPLGLLYSAFAMVTIF